MESPNHLVFPSQETEVPLNQVKIQTQVSLILKSKYYITTTVYPGLWKFWFPDKNVRDC